jgi:SAM-dependent methyltransferase
MGCAVVVETFFSERHQELLERIACPICGASDAKDYRVAHDRLFGKPGEYRVSKCRSCGMAYTNPRPTFDALGRHYPPEYFCYDPPEGLRGLRGYVLRSVARGLVQRRLRMLEEANGRLPSGARVCDVGCGYGALIEALRDRRSCDVTGVDFNPEMARYCETKGLPIHRGTLTGASFAAERFDVVAMTEYLEHESDPRAVLEECRRITKPGGHVVVEVPVISAFGARLFGNYWSQLDLPRHLMFFTPETLRRLLWECGYEILSVRSAHGSIAMSLLHLLGYENIGRMSTRDIVATALATIPLAPFVPFLHEFMFVVARAVEPSERQSFVPEELRVPRELPSNTRAA